MFTSEFNERSRSNPLCDSRLGTVATSDHETPLTGYEPKKDLNLVNTEELDLAATSDVYWQHTLDDDASLNDPNVDDNQIAKYLAVVVDSTGKPVEMRSNNDQFSCDTRNLKSAQSQFPVVAQTEMICQTGGSVQARIAEERENAHAQIRTMLDEQRRTIIAECNEKVLHHELLAAHAEQDRKVLQEELLRQQQEFREVHQQDLMKHLELQKFQNSAFDEFTQKKFIEDQKTIMELSGRLQELQNEVNFMNDSKDFMDAESTCSGNPHVTSPPGLFPRHPPFEGMLKPAFISQRQDEEPPNIWDTSGISGNVFCTPTSFFVSSVSSGIKFFQVEYVEENYRGTNPHVYCREKWKTKARLRSEMPVRTVSQKIQSSSVEETLQRIMGQTNNDCRFRIFILTNSLRQLRLRAGR